MIYFIALIPATGLTVAGYFVLFLSHRSEGAFRAFGKYLGFWAFTLAALVVLGAIFAAAHGGRHEAAVGMRWMHGRMHGRWPGEPRFFGPRGTEPRAFGQAGELQPGAAPQAPRGPAGPTAPAAPAAPPSPAAR
jgi:hypothetical protein